MRQNETQTMIYFPSVTEVLSPWADFSRIPPDVLDAAAKRGTAVHNACFAYAAGLPVIESSEITPYLDSFKRWFDLVVAEVVLCEQRITDDKFGYHGEPDLLVRSKHQEIILTDIKTPVTKMKTWRVQLAAYNNLCEKYTGINIHRVGSLRLSPDGKTPKMDYYDYQSQDFNIFLSCLNTYKYFKQ
jgi:hypothetical protein